MGTVGFGPSPASYLNTTLNLCQSLKSDDGAVFEVDVSFGVIRTAAMTATGELDPRQVSDTWVMPILGADQAASAASPSDLVLFLLLGHLSIPVEIRHPNIGRDRNAVE